MKRRQKTAAVLLAAGTGTRFGGTVPKQYIQIDRSPLVFHTLQKIRETKFFDPIVIVVNKDHESFRRRLERMLGRRGENIYYVAGGSTRSQSTYNAIKFLRTKEVDHVLFHDAVRPFVAPGMLEAVVRAAKQHGAVVTGTPALESTARIKGGKVHEVFEREGLHNLQTPECYRFDIIDKAYERFHSDKKFFAQATNLHLVFALGRDVRVVVHGERNLKITFPQDLPIVKALMSSYE